MTETISGVLSNSSNLIPLSLISNKAQGLSLEAPQYSFNQKVLTSLIDGKESLQNFVSNLENNAKMKCDQPNSLYENNLQKRNESPKTTPERSKKSDCNPKLIQTCNDRAYHESTSQITS